MALIQPSSTSVAFGTSIIDSTIAFSFLLSGYVSTVVPGTSAPCCFAAHITTCSTHATIRCRADTLPVRTT